MKSVSEVVLMLDPDLPMSSKYIRNPYAWDCMTLKDDVEDAVWINMAFDIFEDLEDHSTLDEVP